MADAAIDEGRVKPMLVMGAESVEQMLNQNHSSVILARDITNIGNRIGDHPSISIADSKGLEFMSVVVLDFFRESERQKLWKRYLLDTKPIKEVDPEIEVALASTGFIALLLCTRPS